MSLIIILFIYTQTHSRRRCLRPSLTWIVWWKCLTKRRRWLAIHSAWRWRRPIESTFLKGRRVKNLNGGSTSSPCSPGLIWRCVCHFFIMIIIIIVRRWEIGRVIGRTPFFVLLLNFLLSQTGRHKRNATFPGSKATTIISTQQQQQHHHQQSTAPNSPCLSKGKCWKNFIFLQIKFRAVPFVDTTE